MSLGIFDGAVGLGAVPTKYWADPRVKDLQTLLNPELTRFKCTTQLKVDGLVGPSTCGAWKFVEDAVKTTGVMPSQALIDLIKSQGGDLASGCDAVKPWTAPSCPTPKAAGPTLTSDQILVMQSLLNDEVLKPHGYQLVPETGKLDPLTCGTASATYADVKAGRVKVSTQLSAFLTNAALPTMCQSYTPWVVAKPTTATAPLPAPAPPPPPSASDYSQCWIEYGDKTPVVKELGALINTRLKAEGYKPIALSGTWDAALCGAVSVLKNKYTKWPTKSCPGGVVVPLSCPKTVLPAKAVTTVAKTPAAAKPKVALAGVGLAAAAAAALAFYAKKKGLFG